MVCHRVQASALSCLKTILYFLPNLSIIKVNFHGYADDTQLYVTFNQFHEEESACDHLQRCIAAIRSWMAQHWLKLNDDETKFIVISSPAMLKKVITDHIALGEHRINKSQRVKNIGAMFDASCAMKEQVIKTA